MTGYGSGIATIEGGRLSIEIRALNHRFLDLRTRMPGELSDMVSLLEEIARKHLVRGRLDLSGRLSGDTSYVPKLDQKRARSALEQLRELRDDMAPGEPVPLSLLANVPDLFSPAFQPDRSELRQAVAHATEEACLALIEMRKREGLALAKDLASRLALLRTHVEAIAENCPQVVENYRKRLHERVERLTKDGTIELDKGRLEQEVALFADRADVTEELTRFSAHCDQLDELMTEDEAAIGRKLEFILQEMNRESNTIGSKCSDAGISRLVVELKAELERMREQVQNIL